MAPRNSKQHTTQKARSSLERVAKLKYPPKSDAQPRSYRMKRYKNGLLNLEKTSAHLIPVVQANANSPLLRLPAEIQNKIWDYACGGQTVMLPERWKTTEKGGAVDFPKNEDGTGKDRSYEAATRRPAAFHLPEVCRQVYAETALTSYKRNTFMCNDILVSRTHPMARLMAAQRRAVTTLEPDCWALNDMVSCGNIQGVLSVWPNVCRVVITPEALQWVRAMRMRGPSDEATWTQEQWRACLTDHLKWCKETGIDMIFED